MHKKIGEGGGLVALVDSREPLRVLKIPKIGQWTFSMANDKVNLLGQLSRRTSVVAETRLVEKIRVAWKNPGSGYFGLTSQVETYEGWAFQQNRLFKILEKYPKLQTVDLDQFVRIHHSLWRSGIGFASANELYGMFNKGFDSSGQLVAFDIGSLTCDPERIREKFKNGHYAAKKQKMVFGLSKVNPQGLVARYAAYVDRYLDLTQFEKLWAVDRDQTKNASGSR